MPLRQRLASTAWRTFCHPEYQAFTRAAESVERSQKKVLLGILQRNYETLIGDQYNFTSIQSVSGYIDRLPITSYESYTDEIGHIMSGEPRVLTVAKVNRLHLTSGSAAGQKYIPFNQPLQRDFQKALRAWLYDLFTSRRESFAGKAYWFLTPSVSSVRVPESKIPIEYDQDENYFSTLEKLFLRELLLFPSFSVSHDEETRNTQIACCLLGCSKLSFVSLWNPSLFSIFLDWIEQNIEKVLYSMKEKTTRTSEIESIWRNVTRSSERWQAVWPNLSLVSCWSEAFAESDALALAKLLPAAEIQGKGLLATEGVVSIPLSDGGSPVLTSNVHFYEFENVDTKKIFLAHELEKESRYEVLITTSGGFYRYRLGDVVEVDDYYHEAPRLKFKGKTGQVVDIRGEKLSEDFVCDSLNRVCAETNDHFDFWFLAPWRSGNRAGYSLFVESRPQGGGIQELGKRMEEELLGNPHYSFCRSFGQIEPIEVFHIGEGGKEAYLQYKQRSGARSTVKVCNLETSLHWRESLQNYVVESPSQ